MKTIKKIFICILSFILLNLLLALTVSLNINNIITTGIVKESVKHQILSENYLNKVIDNSITNDKINEILEQEKVNELINKYLNVTIEGILDKENIENINIEEDIISLIRENKELIEAITNEKITDEMIDKVKESLEQEKLNETFKQTISNSNESIPESAKIALKIYDVFISMKFRIALIISIVLDLILIALLEGSIYKWMKNLGITSVIAGILLAAIVLTSRKIISYTTGLATFNIKSITKPSIFLIVCGVVLIIIKEFIDSILKKKGNKEDDLS